MLKRVAVLLIAVFSFMGLNAQTISAENLKKAKEASVFIRVIHNFPLTGDEVTGSGSGFFVSSNGYIITNYHVIQPLVSAYGITFPTPLKKIEVIRHSGMPHYQQYDGTVLAVDKVRDLALIGIDPGEEKLDFLKILPTDSLVELTPVWVFGFPFGEEFGVVERGPEISVTHGEITSLRHDDQGKMDKIQIDAVVNKGNSGGPAINIRGEVVGVVNMRYGDSRVNFAVPGEYVDSIMNSVKPDISVGEESKVDISTPEGAYVFVDGKKVDGNSVKVPHGRHAVCVLKEGSDSYFCDWLVDGPESMEIELKPVNEKTIMGKKDGTKKEDLPDLAGVKPLAEVKGGNSLMKENFGDSKVLDKWVQESGGEKVRTWYIRDGELHQYESDGILHQITTGSPDWTNYVVRTRVRISNKENDSRAGLIFRETEDGFYLFRIHKETGKAQLAYHSKAPFGWFVIQENDLPDEIGEDWHDLAVVANGNKISCYIDDKAVLESCSGYSNSGKVGYYSVESKASFDDLTVTELPLNVNSKYEEECGQESFWFSDNFNEKSTWWYQYEQGSGNPSVWNFSEGGCTVEYSDEVRRVCELTKYRMDNFTMNLIVSVGEAKKGSNFGIILRKNGDNYLEIYFNSKEMEVQLISVEKNKSKILKKENLGDFFDNSNVITVTLKDDYLKCDVFEDTLIEYKGKELNGEPGRIAFSVENVMMIFHQMTINSVTQDGD